MDNKQLLENMGRLGYPLLDAVGDFDPYQTLAEVVRSQEGRYWEGFPVLLANLAKEGDFSYAKASGFLKAEEQEKFRDLFLVSLALYDLNKFKFKWVKDFLSQLTDPEKAKVQNYRNSLAHNNDVAAGGSHLSAERLKNAFQNYFYSSIKEARESGDRQAELSLAFALSQVFSPKQRELFSKKLKGEMLTKTEREYFSRVVRKKVTALANTELHQLARKVVEL